MFLTSLIEALGYTHKREAVKRRRRPLSIDVLEDRRMLATWTVDDDFANNLQCNSTQRKCETIQAAVVAASPGDTIKVSAGTYNEAVTVDKKLTIQGSQNDANQALKNPSHLTNATIVEVTGGTAGFSLAANDIVIRNFTIQDKVAPGDAQGIFMSNSTSGDTIANNIIQNLSGGIDLGTLNTSAARKTTIQDNLIRDNNNAGAEEGDGIYSDRGASNVAITHNYFTGQANASIILVGGPGAATSQSKLTIKDNTLDHDAPIIMVNTSNSQISNNKSDHSIGSGIFLGGGNTKVEVSKNTLTNGAFTGINLRTDPSNYPVVDANSSIQIMDNKISGFGDAGIRVRDGAHDNVVKNNDVKLNGTVGGGLGGITLEDGTSLNQVLNNHVESNKEAGILLNGSTNNTVSNNDVKTNGGDGITVDGTTTAATANKLLGNHVESNKGAGIHLINSVVAGPAPAVNNTVSKNDVKKNAGDGILLDSSTFSTVDHNNVESNGTPAAGVNPATGNGIHLLNSANNTVSSNNVKKNAVDGIFLEDATDNKVNNNNLDSNGVKAKGATPGVGDGIHANAGSTGNTFDHNDAKNNGLYDYEDNSTGLGTAGTANTWTKNKGKTQNRPGLIN